MRSRGAITLLLTTLLAVFPVYVFSSSALNFAPDSTGVSDVSVADPYRFSGLASYYNSVRFYLVEQNEVRIAEQDGVAKTLGGEWLVVAGRFKARVMRGSGLRYEISEGSLNIQNAEILRDPDAVDLILPKHQLISLAPELDRVRYAHLWSWLSFLSRFTESVLSKLQDLTSMSWGMTILLFALLVKLALLPVTTISAGLQRQVNLVTAELAPKLSDIKGRFHGEEAHQRIMAAHKEAGVTPFYTLKPMFGTLIQIPILIAVFNALGEMSQLKDSSLLWIGSLSYPDAIASLPFSIPFLGSNVSILPVAMAVAMLLASMKSASVLATSKSASRTLGHITFTLVVLIILYPFPAAMVLYWTASNLLQWQQQLILKI